MPDNMLTVKETAERLGVSPRTVQRYCRHGNLKHKWVQGVRHKELRILPPITPKGIKGRVGSRVMISCEEFQETVGKLEQELEKRERKLDRLTGELARHDEMSVLIADFKAKINELDNENKHLKVRVAELTLETSLTNVERQLLLRMAKDLSELKKQVKKEPA